MAITGAVSTKVRATTSIDGDRSSFGDIWWERRRVPAEVLDDSGALVGYGEVQLPTGPTPSGEYVGFIWLEHPLPLGASYTVVLPSGTWDARTMQYAPKTYAGRQLLSSIDPPLRSAN